MWGRPVTCIANCLLSVGQGILSAMCMRQATPERIVVHYITDPKEVKRVFTNWKDFPRGKVFPRVREGRSWGLTRKDKGMNQEHIEVSAEEVRQEIERQEVASGPTQKREVHDAS